MNKKMIKDCIEHLYLQYSTADELLPASPATIHDEGEQKPLGILSEEERNAALTASTYCEQENDDDEDNISTLHFNLVPRVHEITKITSRYVGEINRGVVNQTMRRVNTTATLTYEKSRNVSNSFSVSIGFNKDIINGELGYNVEKSSSETASYPVDVPKNKLASITLYDMYNVTKFNVKTTYIFVGPPVNYLYETGTGWAQQWTHFGYSARVW